jgi:hypothetical protein
MNELVELPRQRYKINLRSTSLTTPSIEGTKIDNDVWVKLSDVKSIIIEYENIIHNSRINVSDFSISTFADE